MRRILGVGLAAIAVGLATAGPAAAQVYGGFGSPQFRYGGYRGGLPTAPPGMVTSTPFASGFTPSLPVPAGLRAATSGVPVVSTSVAASTPVLSPFASQSVGGGFASAAPPTSNVLGRNLGIRTMPVRSQAAPVPFASGAYPGGGFGR